MAEPGETRRGLRFGLLCAGPELNGFQRACLEQILAVPGTELALVVVDADPPRRSSPREKLSRLLRWRGVLWPLYQKLFRCYDDPLHARADCSDLFGDAPRIPCAVERVGRWSEHFPNDVVERIRALDLDFLLKFGFGILRGEALTAARYGVWSFHHDDPDVYRGSPPGFWEIHDDAAATGAVLQRLTERLDGGVILQRCWTPTDRTSYRRNYARILQASIPMPARVCRDLLNGCAAYLDAPPIRTNAPIYRAPTNADMLRFGARVLVRGCRQFAGRILRTEQWRVGVARAAPTDFLHPDGRRPPIDWIPNAGSGRYFADPFAVHAEEGRLRLLVEHYDHRAMRGTIDEIEWRPGAASTPRLAIDDARHHSYPYLLRQEGRLWCIPETASERRVALYAPGANGAWERRAILLEGVAALDATIFPYEGRWWMLFTDEAGPWNGNLAAYFAPALEGPWTPHANNPIKLDVRSSRSAGPPFRRGEDWIRPAQDCSRSYGCRLALNRLVKLTPTEFEEETLGWIEPDPHGACPDGIHTIVAAGPYTLVDGKRMELDWPMVAFRLTRRLRGLLGAGR